MTVAWRFAFATLVCLLANRQVSADPATAAAPKEASAPTDASPQAAPADNPAPTNNPEAATGEGGMPLRSAANIVARARPALVVIRVSGRDGSEHGLGAGFVVHPDGLIATNLHVIGDSRPFQVELATGAKLQVTEVHASDRHLDLAVLRVQTNGQPLSALELADSDTLSQGDPIAAMGSPLGLQNSIVTGVVAARREIEGRGMIQLSMPIQPGNSGGPVLDERGRVHGVVTMMSVRQSNVGFAVPSNDLQALLKKPNPIPMARWLTQGTLDPKLWQSRLGGQWRQRGGHILASGAGNDFGARSLCFSLRPAPNVPYEIATHVRLDDESGAAGLVFHGDDQDRHYGFYPSNGRLRLSCFEGPTVYEWRVLREVASNHYRRGEWNELRVRVEAEKLTCYVNGQPVIESTDKTFTTGKVGLVKFRQINAQFRQFQVGKELGIEAASPEAVASAAKLLDSLPPLASLNADQLTPWKTFGRGGAPRVEARAAELERRAAELKKIAADMHTNAVSEELQAVLDVPADLDLLRGALLLASLDQPDLDIPAYVAQVDRMSEEIRGSLANDADEPARLAALNRYLFTENGFHGSRFEYDHQANSYLNRVIDDREGLPITLSVLYIELGRRLQLNVQGIGLPGHFIVKHVPREGEPQLIDPFDQGKPLTRDDAARIVQQQAGQPWSDDYLQAAAPRQILTRMLRNLLRLAQQQDDKEAMLRYLSALLVLDPESVADRGMRAVVRSETGRRDLAVTDLDWILEKQPAGLDLEKLHEMREFFLSR